MAEEKNGGGIGLGEAMKENLKETMKKVVMTGVGTIFLTEETIRNVLGEVKLPKELWNGIIENASKTKTEFMGAFAHEVAQIVSKIDIAGEAKKFFEHNKMKISIEVSFDHKHDSKKKD